MDYYNFYDKLHNEYIYLEIKKGMHSFTQYGTTENKISRNASHNMYIVNSNIFKYY